MSGVDFSGAAIAGLERAFSRIRPMPRDPAPCGIFHAPLALIAALDSIRILPALMREMGDG